MKHFATLFVLGTAALLNAQTLDPTFGTGGVVLQDAGGNDIINDIALQADGKIVAAGVWDDGVANHMLVARVNTDGTLDNTFSGDGLLVVPTGTNFSIGYAVAVQSDGNIVVAGSSEDGATTSFTVWRFLANGDPDPSFATAGVYFNAVQLSSGYLTDLAIQGDGKLVMTGYLYPSYGLLVMRLTTGGTLDNTFDGVGVNVVEQYSLNRQYLPRAIKLQPDGKLVVAGSYRDFSLATNTHEGLCARFNTDGALDTTFGGGDGIVIVALATGNEYVYTVGIQDDGRIVMVGEGVATGASEGDLLVERLNPDGTPDATLGTLAVIWDPSGDSEYTTAFVIQPDGNYLAAGSSSTSTAAEAFIARFTAAAALPDASFGTNGYHAADFGDFTFAAAALLQPDGKFVIAGYSKNVGLPNDMMLARYDVGILAGTWETAVTDGQLEIVPNPSDGRFTVRAPGAIDRMEIIDAQGRTVVHMRDLPGEVLLDLHNQLQPGLYHLHVNSRTTRTAHCIILQNN